jgi:hypothetical protein
MNSHWSELCELLKNHPGGAGIAKVNRLWRKHPSTTKPEPMPTLKETELSILAEEWGVAALWTVVHEKQVTEDEPWSNNGAVIVLRWEGSHYLLDGRRRINRWRRAGLAGLHRVLVLVPIKGISGQQY